jgi:hypothetical protein
MLMIVLTFHQRYWASLGGCARGSRNEISLVILRSALRTKKFVSACRRLHGNELAPETIGVPWRGMPGSVPPGSRRALPPKQHAFPGRATIGTPRGHTCSAAWPGKNLDPTASGGRLGSLPRGMTKSSGTPPRGPLQEAKVAFPRLPKNSSRQGGGFRDRKAMKELRGEIDQAHAREKSPQPGTAPALGLRAGRGCGSHYRADHRCQGDMNYVVALGT